MLLFSINFQRSFLFSSMYSFWNGDQNKHRSLLIIGAVNVKILLNYVAPTSWHYRPFVCSFNWNKFSYCSCDQRTWFLLVKWSHLYTAGNISKITSDTWSYFNLADLKLIILTWPSGPKCQFIPLAHWSPPPANEYNLRKITTSPMLFY